MSSVSRVCYNKIKFIVKSRDDQPDDEVIDTFCLDGEYEIKCGYPNRAALEEGVNLYSFESAVDLKAVYMYGNILYKSDEPNIWDYLDLMIMATYKTKLPVPVNCNVEHSKKIEWGTICPTIHTLFSYDGKLFTLYGRYIYGYDAPYVRFLKLDKLKKDHASSDTPKQGSMYSDKLKKDHGHNDKPKQCNVAESKKADAKSEEVKKTDEDAIEEYYGNWKINPPIMNSEEIVLPVVPNNIRCKELENFLCDYMYAFTIVDEKTKVLHAFALYR
ncbi:unnamed protein product [Diatraea saccharalis]|uniref:Uncharacterized protein n=1 Tax=Diatraea saccharalis TaxID=40085 RepID=A0A9N9WHE7_9NEOP|nr:unnamed protein product [Diatraea saccharalis]